jgi:hypothetical protein
MSPRTLAVSGALLIVVAVPAGARAATITPLEPCYVTANTAKGDESQSVFFRGGGFTANSKVDVSLDDKPVPELTGLQTDAGGNLGAQGPALFVPAPFIAKGTRDFTLTLTEAGNPANRVTATSKTTALGVDVKPKSAKPSQRIRFSGRGFTAERNVYAHYVYGGRLRKTVKMARPQGPCGRWTSHRRQIPIRNPRTGSWFVQFDQLKKYVDPSRTTPKSVYVRLEIVVSRVFHR